MESSALNLVQFVIAVYQVYRSSVLNFGDLFKLLDNDWSASYFVPFCLRPISLTPYYQVYPGERI